MNKKNFLNYILIFLLLISCSSKGLNQDKIEKKNLDLQVLEAYNEGMKALEGGDVLFAAKKFNEAEILFPQSETAPKSALMAAYSYYIQDYYGDAIAELIRFKKIYPKHKNLDYANYLLAMCYYEQIVDEKKDLQAIIKAKESFILILKNYPNTDYALDAEFKIDLINDVLASKEMYVGRYYFKKKKWIPAINRFRTIIDEYDTTIYVEEALHRLVEINYKIGLIEESQKYANVLGYNYLSSNWYKKSYKIFNKDYSAQVSKKIKKDKKGVLDKFKKFFD